MRGISSELFFRGAKVSFILRHRGAQLILAYSWARPAILVAGKGRGDVFFLLLFLHSFLFLFLPCPSLSSPVLSLLSFFSLSLGDDTKWPTRVDVSLNPNSINSLSEKGSTLKKKCRRSLVFRKAYKKSQKLRQLSQTLWLLDEQILTFEFPCHSSFGRELI